MSLTETHGPCKGSFNPTEDIDDRALNFEFTLVFVLSLVSIRIGEHGGLQATHRPCGTTETHSDEQQARRRNRLRGDKSGIRQLPTAEHISDGAEDGAVGHDGFSFRNQSLV